MINTILPETSPEKQIYLHHYLRFIEKCQKKDPVGYTEKHHILPKSLGGSDETENLVVLSAADHYIAHKLLWKAYGGKMTFAFHQMNLRMKVDRNLQVYIQAKECWQALISLNNKGKPSPMLGRHHSEVAKKKISLANKGRTYTSRPVSEETKRKIGLANQVNSRGNQNRRGKSASAEARKKIGDAHKGKHASEETRAKISKALLGRTPWNKGKLCWSEDQKRQRREYRHSEEVRQKMRGRHYTSEEKAEQSTRMKEVWRRKKEKLEVSIEDTP